MDELLYTFRLKSVRLIVLIAYFIYKMRFRFV
ncbi:hypothetical protein LCGC14_1103360 [marine sediment metagenome]|uniref:Uncharacterized protein n=1 Tax=marine sediment metagenome TaxID=412755 RepID=A0A0F9MDC8_9ZZZZ